MSRKPGLNLVQKIQLKHILTVTRIPRPRYRVQWGKVSRSFAVFRSFANLNIFQTKAGQKRILNIWIRRILKFSFLQKSNKWLFDDNLFPTFFKVTFVNDNSCSVCFVYSSNCGTETEQYEKKNNDKNYKCSPIVELFHTALAEAADIHQSSQSGSSSRSSLHCGGRWDKYFDGK